MEIINTVQILLFLAISSTALTNNFYGYGRVRGRASYSPVDVRRIDQYGEHSPLTKSALHSADESSDDHPVAINFETDEENKVISRILRTQEKPPCDELEGKQGYCTEDPEYNRTIENLFNKLLQKIPSIHVLKDVLNETIIEEADANYPHLRNRVGFSSEQTLCASVETIIYPKRGQTANKDWVFILNQGPVQQGVKVEKCLKPNGPCVLGGGPIELTACRQKYVYKKLLAMDNSGNNIVSESIYMPSCCVCYVSNDFVSARSSFRANRTKV